MIFLSLFRMSFSFSPRLFHPLVSSTVAVLSVLLSLFSSLSLSFALPPLPRLPRYSFRVWLSHSRARGESKARGESTLRGYSNFECVCPEYKIPAVAAGSSSVSSFVPQKGNVAALAAYGIRDGAGSRRLEGKICSVLFFLLLSILRQTLWKI